MDEPEECSRSNTELPSVPQQYLLRDLAPRPRTLWDIITTTAEMNPDAAALDDGEIITYSELIHEVEAWAAELHANGVRRGDRIRFAEDFTFSGGLQTTTETVFEIVERDVLRLPDHHGMRVKIPRWRARSFALAAS